MTSRKRKDDDAIAERVLDSGRDWPADSFAYRPLASMAPFDENPKKHPEDQIQRLMRQIAEIGWTSPVAIDPTGRILAGHARYEAATRMGIEQVPSIVVRRQSEAEYRAFVIADNKLTEAGSYDEELLRLTLSMMEDEGVDLELAGMGDDEIEKLLEEAEDDHAQPELVSAKEVRDTFWITVQGPLHAQAYALKRLHEVMDDLPDVTVELGTVSAIDDDDLP